MEKKHRQHYVWRRYLEAWSDGNQVWCKREGRIFRTNLINVAVQKDFYQVQDLTSSELAMVRALVVDQMHQGLKEVNEGWLTSFTAVFRLRDLIDNSGLMTAEIEGEMNVLIHNMEENLHEQLERLGLPLLRSILDEDISFYGSEQGCIDFAFFIATQYMRTAKIKRAICENLAELKAADISKIWGVMSHILATGMAWSLYVRQKEMRMVLLTTDGCSELITGDQPVINTCAEGTDAKEVPTDLELYYPVSPRLAVVITKDEELLSKGVIDLDSERVSHYNRLISDMSESQLYAHNDQVLKSV